MKHKYLVLASLCLIVFWLFQFRQAFTVHFFQDDYFFLEISAISSFPQFLHFFSPFRSYSYKPLASETFYMVIHWLQYNVIAGHVIMFATFLIGVYFLYRVILLLTQDRLLSLLTSGLYLLHFTHVFQLYWFATYQEIAMMTLLLGSTWCLLKQKNVVGFALFTLALLCKETAALFPLGLALLTIFDTEKRISWKVVLSGFVFSGIFYGIYQFSLTQVTSLDNYKMSFNPRLIGNNMAWYGLWALGLPNLMPLYMTSLFHVPNPTFWNLFGIPEFKHYFSYLMVYLVLFGLSTIGLLFSLKKSVKAFVWYFVFCGAGFFIFLGPILFFPHRWMVRLTLPLLFASLFQAYVFVLMIRRSIIFKVMAGCLLALYVIWNFYGTAFHESSSLYLPENDIFLRTQSYLEAHHTQIVQSGVIFFQDTDRNRRFATQNSERLKNSFHDQSFLAYFFPDVPMKAFYNFETDQVPPSAYIINSYDLVR